MKRKISTLKNRLVIYNLAVMLVMAVSIVGVFHTIAADHQKQQATEYTQVLLHSLDANVTHAMMEAENATEVLEERIKPCLNRPDSIMACVRRVLENNEIMIGASATFVPGYYTSYGNPDNRFMEYVLRDENDNMIEKHMGQDGDYKYEEMQWFKAPHTSGEALWSEPYIDKASGNKRLITYSHPVRDKQGHIVAIVTADLAIDKLVRDVENITSFDGSYSFILSRNGNVIVHPDSSVVANSFFLQYAERDNDLERIKIVKAMLSRDKGAVEVHHMPTDRNVLCVYAPMPYSGWSVCQVLPMKSVLRHLNSTLISLMVIMLLTVVVVVVLSWYLANHALKPVAELTDNIKRIGLGNFRTPLPDMRTGDELMHMQMGINELQNQLKDYCAELALFAARQQYITDSRQLAHQHAMLLPPVYPLLPFHPHWGLMGLYTCYSTGITATGKPRLYRPKAPNRLPEPTETRVTEQMHLAHLTDHYVLLSNFVELVGTQAGWPMPLRFNVLRSIDEALNAIVDTDTNHEHMYTGADIRASALGLEFAVRITYKGPALNVANSCTLGLQLMGSITMEKEGDKQVVVIQK